MARRVIKAALARSGLTVGEMCGRACISERTFYSHVKAGTLTAKELKKIDKVLHLSDEEIAGIIRG